MKIFIDGDGSPVKEEAITIAEKYHLEVVIVTSIDHHTSKEYPNSVTFVYVDKGNDSADYKIVALIREGDLLVTQDYGLASLVLPKGAKVLHQTGKTFNSENIDILLEQRYHSGKLRKAGIRSKGPKPFTKKEREAFREALEKEIVKEVL